MLPELTRLKDRVLSVFFPQWCLGCGREGEILCPSCQKALPKIAPPLCPRCGLPQMSGILCPSCLLWASEVDGIRSAFRFEGTVRQAIHQLKYRNLKALAAPLANLLSDFLAVNPIPAEVLVPVPLHPKRLRERGYNQSALLAQELSKLIDLPVADNCLTRRRHTPAQARTASVDERRSNVAGAFDCRDRRLEGKAVLLIDDVATSGATLDACAVALKDAGAGSVWGLSVAREV